MDGDEADGVDECLCALDYDGRENPPTGLVFDDTMHDIMVKPLPPGCRLTALFDCGHSGTLLDLPYIYDAQGVYKHSIRSPHTIQRKSSEAVVVSLSGYKDNEGASGARGDGTLKEAFIKYIERFGNDGTYLQAIQSVRAHMVENGLEQLPLLSSSHWIDTDQKFIITG